MPPPEVDTAFLQGDGEQYDRRDTSLLSRLLVGRGDCGFSAGAPGLEYDPQQAEEDAGVH